MCAGPNKQERVLTMQERINAFYLQSGGPGNPQIKPFLERHLTYGKDHGTPGYRETVEDALIDTVVDDPSMLALFQRYARWRGTGRPAEKPEPRLEAQLEDLQTAVQDLRKQLEGLQKWLETPPKNE